MSADHLIRMPQLGLTMTEGTLVEWLVEPGQTVAEGDLLYIVETDKIANEIPADHRGTFGKGIVQPGETVDVGTVIGCWLVDGKMPDIESDEQALTARPASPEEVGSKGGHHQGIDQAPLTQAAATPTRIIATPHARKLAREHAIDIARVRGSGPKGRIRGADVLAVVETGTAPGAATTAATENADTRKALSGIQRTIAQRMMESNRDVPLFYLTADAEISELLHYHGFLKQKPDFPRLTLTHWIATAVGLVLAETPLYRTVYSDGEHLILADSAVGIAIATDKGLYAPIARGVGRSSLAGNAVQIEQLVRQTHQEQLSTADLSGAAITVSNLGGMNIRQVYPLVNPGQSSILGVGKVNELFRPDAEGNPSLRRELGLVIACDHRVYNGVDGARLLNAIIALLEDPLLILAKTPRS